MIYEIPTASLREKIVFGIILLVAFAVVFLLLRKAYRKVMSDIDKGADAFSQMR